MERLDDMRTKLVIVEGLPGSGKTTTASALHEIVRNNNINSELYLEGNLDHPADYDGVASFSLSEWEQLLNTNQQWDALVSYGQQKGDNILLPYRKIINQDSMFFSKEQLNDIYKHDIYELPFEQHAMLAAEKWAEFTEKALQDDKLYIFECCFIQNPLTIGMIKWGIPQEIVVEHVLSLEKIIRKLNPVLLYVDQDNLPKSFRKAYNDRPEEWRKGFIEYYTKQGYGKKHHHTGLNGTVEVLKRRKELELEIYEQLTIKKYMLNNSLYDKSSARAQITDTLASFYLI